MTRSFAIQPGRRLSMLLSPEDGCIYFENLDGTTPMSFWAAIHPVRHLLIIRRCTSRFRDAGMLTFEEDGKGYRYKCDELFMNLLYRQIGLADHIPCRIRSIERLLRNGDVFLFDLKKVEICGGTTQTNNGRDDAI